MASLLLGNLGSSLLGPLGGWIGSAIGSFIDNMLFSPKPEDQRGPRIEDLNVTRADPGVPIPLVFGADRIPGIVIASTPLIETVNKEKVGGKGGPTQTVITYTYHVEIDYMLCEGPILGIARIWAEGNLVRGTRYEMETSTAEFPENIGGIPYPEYYRQHLYDPNLIPWSLDRTYFPSDEGVNYIMTPNRLSMIPISDSAATAMLENGIEVVYWKDTNTGYYIPVREDHAYGVARDLTGRPPEVLEYAAPFQGAGGNGNSGALKDFYTFIDLGAFMDADTLAQLSSSGGYLSMSATSVVGATEAFGVYVASGQLKFEVDFYRDGGTRTVDGNDVGEFISGGNWQWSRPNDAKEYEFSPNNADGGSFNLSAPIPPETRFIVISTSYALTFPVFALWHETRDTRFSITYTKVYTGDEKKIRDWPDYWNLYDAINDWSDVAVLQFKGVDNLTVYHGTMDQHPDAHMQTALAAEFVDTLEAGESFNVPAYIGRAHVVFERLELIDYGNRVPNFTFEVVQYDDVRIAMVLQDMMRRAQVDEKYYDLSALPSVGQRSHVLGYSIGTKTTYRAAMESIMEAFRVDCAEIGNELVFRPRDRSYEWVIDWQDLAAVEAGRSPDEIVELQYRDQVEMPRSLTVRFKDAERSYNVNTAHYYRQQGVSVQESMVELASVMPPEIAKSHARDKMRDVWLERVSVRIKAPHKYIYVYPTDIVKINGGDYGKQDIVFKVTTVTRGANGVLEIEGVMREQTVYVPLEGEVTRTPMDNSTWTNRPSPVIVQPTFSLMEFIDTAPLNEQDVGGRFNPLLFYGAMGGGNGWRGAGLYASVDEGVTYTQLMTSSTRAVIGYTTTALPYHRAEFVDTTNSVDVELVNAGDDLETINAQQFYAGFNYCKIGDEILQFMDAQKLVGFSNRWRLSTLNRGRRGTDLDTILRHHTSGEKFVILQAGPVFKVETPYNQINQQRLFKVVPFGANLADVDPISFTHRANLLKPFAPVFVRGVRDSINNLSVQWIRQDRVGFGWYEGQDALYGDAEVSYVIEFLNPAGTDVVRVFNLTAEQNPYDRGELIYENVEYGKVMFDYNVSDTDPFTGNWLYTPAMQTADGYIPGDPVWVRVYATYYGVNGHTTTARV